VDRLRADYDATPYTSDAFPQSAPGQLAAIAHVFGLDVPAVSRARVLEIGCAAGGNIIPFAAAHPEALAVGIDLSQVQIDLGRERAQALGLDNLEFVAGDIARTNLTGAFDYIVAHGVYSWVPPDVQEALLAAIGRLLAPNGVAYLSYNTYPGWKAKEVMRDAMLLASGASTTTADKVRDARGMVDFLSEVHLLEKCGGVQVLVEQYLDFVVNRMFRESLFVHAQRATQIRYDLDANRWRRMHFAAWTPPVDGPTRLDHSRQEYEVADGATLFTNDPGLKATLETLNEQWPWTLSRDELVEAARPPPAPTARRHPCPRCPGRGAPCCRARGGVGRVRR
jgi:SAM-dependent methyltransferase